MPSSTSKTEARNELKDSTTPIDTKASPWGNILTSVFVQNEPVSRPLVQVMPRNAAPLTGRVITITVSHNRMASGSSTLGSATPWPLQSLTCTWDSKKLPTSFVSTTPTPAPGGGTMNVSVYSVTVPANMLLPATVTVLALEAPDTGNPSVPSVVGENQVIY